MMLRILAAAEPPSWAAGVTTSLALSEQTRELMRRPTWICCRRRLASKDGAATSSCCTAAHRRAPTARRAARAVARGPWAPLPARWTPGRRTPPTSRAGRRETPARGVSCSSSAMRKVCTGAAAAAGAAWTRAVGTGVSSSDGIARSLVGAIGAAIGVGAVGGAERVVEAWQETTRRPALDGLRRCRACSAMAAVAQRSAADDQPAERAGGVTAAAEGR
mmetsp:Transcript_55043/g.120011  ORF Transcript_55043/g.120011 Transcript_55043/m.120011 type:complete len:219 (+) Transcript_55043:366-1022(+)